MPSFPLCVQTVEVLPDVITEESQLQLHVIESSDATVVLSQLDAVIITHT